MSNISPVNVFTPATEIDNIARFAGRAAELQALARALESDGVQIVIYGNRGIGKSSLARVLENLATNSPAVIDRLTTKPFKQFDFLPVFFRCDDSVVSIPKLLLRLLSDDSALAPWVPFKVTEKKDASEIGGNLSIKVVSLGGKALASTTEQQLELDTDVVSVFCNALKKIADSGVAKDGVLLIIDEFDRIKDRAGIASLMKTLGPQRVTFALVGVATTIQELITEHESVARQLADGSLYVPPMTEAEMQEVFNRAETLLNNKYKFAEDARKWIIEISRGHPFYVHLVGKHALLRAIDSKVNEVTKETAQKALEEIALKGSAPIQEAAYKTAIGHSYIRESVLKSFAAVSDDEIHTTELYSGIAKMLNIDPAAISVYVGQLGSDKFGAVLMKTRERYYRFRDSLFKAYASARPYQLRPGDKEEDA